MDFILPDERTMEVMREEFAKLRFGENASAFAFADDLGDTSYTLDNTLPADSNGDTAEGNPLPSEQENANIESSKSSYISTLFLLLYFVKHMRYNMSYGTQIFDTHRGMEQIRSVRSRFGKLNGIN